MSSASYDDAPRPLTDRERSLMKRMFSDYFEVPGEWKTELKADLERDPPILGSITLGGQGINVQPNSVLNVHVAAGANIDLNKLAASGQIGSSLVEIFTAAIRLGGDVDIVRTAADQVDIDDKLRVDFNAGANVTGLWLNENGTLVQVKVGAAGSGPGGAGRALWVS